MPPRTCVSCLFQMLTIIMPVHLCHDDDYDDDECQHMMFGPLL